jgi:hypothetical protein
MPVLAVLAFVSFLLAFFDAKLGSIDFVILGLIFLSAHFAFSGYVSRWTRRA